MAKVDSPTRQVWLQFLDKPKERKKSWLENLSAVATHGGALFAADDEKAEIVRLVPANGGYLQDRTTRVSDLVSDLPGGADGEMDIEGLSVEGGHLWVVGSHSLAREKPKENDDVPQALAQLAEVRDDPNRHFLGRLSLAAPAGGGPADLRAGAHLPMLAGQGRLRDLGVVFRTLVGRQPFGIRQAKRPFPVALAAGGEHGVEGDGVGGRDHRSDRGAAARHRTTADADDQGRRGAAVLRP
jgi:uncharacterized protein DUF3616